MRILMLSWEYPPNLVGGLGVHVAELVPALVGQGVELTVLTPRWKGGAAQEALGRNSMLYRVDPPVEKLSNYFADVEQTNLNLEQTAHALWERGEDFELVHAHDWLVSFAAKALKRLHKVPLVATMHATERGRGRGELDGELAEAINGAEWWLTYEAWRVITTSHYMANEVRNYFGLPADKISVIPNGVNPERFEQNTAEERAVFRAQWARPDEKIIFYVGRVQLEKGVHLLVEAAARLAERGEKFKMIIAGTGALVEELRARVIQLGLQERVLIPGYVGEATRDMLYRVADVAVFPSLYEPFGIVALEAMAARCPVIVSDVGGLAEVVDNGVTGIKISPNDLDALVAAIQNVFTDAEAAEARAMRSFQVVCHEFEWSHIARATAGLYGEIIRARAMTRWE